jgi:hypothetical protein
LNAHYSLQNQSGVLRSVVQGCRARYAHHRCAIGTSLAHVNTGFARRFGAAATREKRPIGFDVQRHDRETKRRGSFS